MLDRRVRSFSKSLSLYGRVLGFFLSPRTYIKIFGKYAEICGNHSLYIKEELEILPSPIGGKGMYSLISKLGPGEKSENWEIFPSPAYDVINRKGRKECTRGYRNGEGAP